MRTKFNCFMPESGVKFVHTGSFLLTILKVKSMQRSGTEGGYFDAILSLCYLE